MTFPYVLDIIVSVKRNYQLTLVHFASQVLKADLRDLIASRNCAFVWSNSPEWV